MNAHFESFHRDILPVMSLFEKEMYLIQQQLDRNLPLDKAYTFDLPENSFLSSQFFQECTAFVQLAQDYQSFPPYSYQEFQELAKILRTWRLSITIALLSPSSPLSTDDRLYCYPSFMNIDTTLRSFLKDPQKIKKWVQRIPSLLSLPLWHCVRI